MAGRPPDYDYTITTELPSLSPSGATLECHTNMRALRISTATSYCGKTPVSRTTKTLPPRHREYSRTTTTPPLPVTGN